MISSPKHFCCHIIKPTICILHLTLARFGRLRRVAQAADQRVLRVDLAVERAHLGRRIRIEGIDELPSGAAAQEEDRKIAKLALARRVPGVRRARRGLHATASLDAECHRAPLLAVEGAAGRLGGDSWPPDRRHEGIGLRIVAHMAETATQLGLGAIAVFASTNPIPIPPDLFHDDPWWLVRLNPPRRFPGERRLRRRVVDALQTVDREGVACPANWRPGDKVIVPPPTTAEDAETRVADPELEVSDWYFSKKQL